MNKENDPEYLNNLRHSTAHLVAAAVVELWPGAKLTIGPAIEDGFYYDIDFPEPVSEKDLPRIEEKMKELLPSWESFAHQEVTKEEAEDIFKDNPYKLELIQEISKRGDPITLYTAGGFTDLCRGGHVDKPSKELRHFKLLTLAGAYWRGDETKPMLTRVYGTAFPSKEELKEYLANLAEAKKRDHRKLGQQLDLFTFSDLVGSGLPLFTPRGQAMREAISDFLWQLSKKYDYQKVSIPHIARLALYETSGHADKFKDEFFYVHGAQSGQDFVMKPMNCPHHTQIYASKPRSYKELPVRFTELTMQYRDEKPGQLLGLSRVRSITIDDAHVFVTPDQIKQEVANIVRIIQEFYSALGMWNKDGGFWVSLSVRDPKTPEKYLGKEENWDKAEQYLQTVSDELGLDAKRMEGEAAFYGPKLDFMFRDSLNREWQLATAQIDFVQPERFGLEYATAEGTKETPVMIHRAVAGSLERFMAILLEHYAGHLPLWLSPTQVAILPISDEQKEYAESVVAQLKAGGIRAELDGRSESIGKKIREAELMKIPVMLIVGKKEVEADTVAVRSHAEGDEGAKKLDEVITALQDQIKNRS